LIGIEGLGEDLRGLEIELFSEMGNTNVRESAVVVVGGGGGVGGGLQQGSAIIGVGHGVAGRPDVQQVPSYGGAPQPTFIHAQQRAAQVASVDSMGGQSSSNSSGTAGRSPLMFAHEVGAPRINLVCLTLTFCCTIL
jgi:hypothetical protein